MLAIWRTQSVKKLPVRLASLHRYGRFFSIFVCILLLLFGSIFLLCYVVDPLWCFTHANRWNSKQISFNERQQKSDYLAVRNNNYDILILGSSRTTFLKAADIGGKHAFNFAVNAMMPVEYQEYSAFFRRHNYRTPTIIVVGLDFYATNENFHGYDFHAPSEYFRNAESPWWRYSALLSRDALNYSLRNISQTHRSTKLNFYNRQMVKTAANLPPTAKQHLIDRDLAMFRLDFYGNTYKYQDLKAVYRKLLADNRKSKFIVFTTPDSLPLWKMLLEEGRLEDYLRWLGDIVEVFGGVYDFMGENSFTSNPDNYMDGHHFYPQAGKTIASRIMSSTPGLPGTLVTRDNYLAYAASIRARYADSKR